MHIASGWWNEYAVAPACLGKKQSPGGSPGGTPKKRKRTEGPEWEVYTAIVKAAKTQDPSSAIDAYDRAVREGDTSLSTSQITMTDGIWQVQQGSISCPDNWDVIFLSRTYIGRVNITEAAKKVRNEVKASSAHQLATCSLQIRRLRGPHKMFARACTFL